MSDAVRIKQSKRDYSNFIFHFTKSKYKPLETEEIDEFWGIRKTTMALEMPAFDRLVMILKEGVIRTSSLASKRPCVSFSESHLSDIVYMLNREGWNRGRYDLYGVAVHKKHAFENSVRPVIYQEAGRFDLLPDELKHLHVRFEPPEIDFTWEREWRAGADFKIDVANIFAIVPTFDESEKLMKMFSGLKAHSLELLV